MRILILSIVCFLLLGFWLDTVSSQVETKREKTPPVVTIKSEGRGAPFVNFKDGADAVKNDAQTNGGQPAALASADFDSDGVADLITADANGKIRFYRGNENALRASSDTKSTTNQTPFDATDKTFSLNISPDYFVAGDYNADGRQDIIAAAKDANFITLVQGDGRGDFSEPQRISVDGRVTAFAAGEIGRADGQTDLAVAVQNKKGAFLIVFEHPEGAFRHKPEIFKLPAPANDLAIGNLDEDAYADIAVACGGDLVIVHGRGQAYPWDLADEFGIKRPGAVVADRKMPFQIAALAVGDFDGRRGEDLAILGGDGSVYNLAPTREEKPANNKLTVEAKARAATSAFLPSDASLRNLGAIADPRISQEEGEKLGLTYADADDLKSGRFEEILKKRTDEQVEKFKAADKDELKKAGAENMAKTLAEREQSKAAFLRSISAKPSTLANWSLETLISDARLTSAAYSPISKKFLKARVSDSGRDDLILLDANSKQIQIVSQPSAVSGQQSAENGDLFPAIRARAFCSTILSTI